MRQALLLLYMTVSISALHAQDRKTVSRNDLPDMKKSIHTAVENLPLYTQNLADHAKEHDVNSIILDIEKYIDSMPRTKKYSDVLLMKNFDALRHFFLTTTNKTTVATSFLYDGAPYRFCRYDDSAVALHIAALRCGDVYNLGKMTDNRVIKTVFENCILPALKALDEFRIGELKYVALSVYYGCKDTREGAPAGITPYCLTFVDRLPDIQQYESGLITAKVLMASADLYLSTDVAGGEYRKIQVETDK